VPQSAAQAIPANSLPEGQAARGGVRRVVHQAQASRDCVEAHRSTRRAQVISVYAGGVKTGQRQGGGAAGPASAFLLAFLLTFGLVASRSACANDPARAEQLYELGRKLMAEGRTSAACASFAESDRLDPATGTLLNLAACHEAEGKLATAWAEFREAQAAARHDGRDDRERFAAEHVAGLEPRLSYLRIIVAPQGPADTIEVKLDESVLGATSWGVAAPIDPGPHEVTARAPGRTPFLERVVVTAAPVRLDVNVVLAVGSVGAAAINPGADGVSRASADTSGATAPPARARVGGAVALGVGVAAVALGVGFGLRAQSKWAARNSAAGQCDAQNTCSGLGVQYGNQAATAATVCDVAFAFGALALGTAGYLLLVRKEPRPTATAMRLHVAPSLSQAEGALTLTGSW
jgi:hypothetical protein